MKLLGVQNFAVMMVTATLMVHAVPLVVHTTRGHIDPTQLLKQIKETAKNATQHVVLSKNVERTPRDKNGETCLKKFFCWAETSLKNFIAKENLSENKSLKKLSAALNEYNREVKITTCPLKSNEEYSLGRFLEDIESCVDYRIEFSYM